MSDAFPVPRERAFVTSLPFLIAATAVGREMGLLDPATSAGLVTAGLVSVLVFPTVAVALLPRVGVSVSV